jgi:hypothetical protein
MGEHIENGINIDPVPLTVEEFAVAGNIDGKVSSCICTLQYLHLNENRPSPVPPYVGMPPISKSIIKSSPKDCCGRIE